MAPEQQTKYKIRVPDEIACLIRGSHPQLKRKIKAGLKHILADPQTGKSLKDKFKYQALDLRLLQNNLQGFTLFIPSPSNAYFHNS